MRATIPLKLFLKKLNEILHKLIRNKKRFFFEHILFNQDHKQLTQSPIIPISTQQHDGIILINITNKFINTLKITMSSMYVCLFESILSNLFFFRQKVNNYILISNLIMHQSSLYQMRFVP